MEERVLRDRTARQSYVLLNQSSVTNWKSPVRRRAPGPGLVLAVIVSMTLWLGLFWIARETLALVN
jgi:hypothetical protein